MPVFETPIAVLLFVAIGAYLLGSVPFGIVVSRLFGLPDPRTIGSKNIGATNVLRSGSKKAALVTVFLDGAKGFAAVVIARMLVADDAAQVAGLAAFLGHLYPVWLGFKGGKGVATFLGVMFGLGLVIGLIGAACWLAAFLLFRYSSLSAVLTAMLAPVICVFAGFGEVFSLLTVMAVLLIWRHRANIERLRDGSEPRVEWGKKG